MRSSTASPSTRSSQSRLNRDDGAVLLTAGDSVIPVDGLGPGFGDSGIDAQPASRMRATMASATGRIMRAVWQHDDSSEVRSASKVCRMTNTETQALVSFGGSAIALRTASGAA